MIILKLKVRKNGFSKCTSSIDNYQWNGSIISLRPQTVTNNLSFINKSINIFVTNNFLDITEHKWQDINWLLTKNCDTRPQLCKQLDQSLATNNLIFFLKSKNKKQLHKSKMAPFTAAGANKYLISPFLSTIIAASRTLLQQLITCLNFPLDSEDLFYCYKQQKWFVWTTAAQGMHKQPKTMEMSETYLVLIITKQVVPNSRKVFNILDPLQQCFVYQAQVDSANLRKYYLRPSEDEFKTRYNNHTMSFRNKSHKKKTELSKYVYKVKILPSNEVLLQKPPLIYGGSKCCDLCLTEKLLITKADPRTVLNKRSETVSKCCHRNKFTLKRFR